MVWICFKNYSQEHFQPRQPLHQFLFDKLQNSYEGFLHLQQQAILHILQDLSTKGIPL